MPKRLSQVTNTDEVLTTDDLTRVQDLDTKTTRANTDEVTVQPRGNTPPQTMTTETLLDGLATEESVASTNAAIQAEEDAREAADQGISTRLNAVEGGLDQSEVDARIEAGVEDWAETGNTDTLPVNKIPTDIARTAAIPDVSSFATGTELGDAITNHNEDTNSHADIRSAIPDVSNFQTEEQVENLLEATVTALASRSVISWAVPSRGGTADLTLSTNATLILTGGVDGSVAFLRVTQDTTGSHPLTLHTSISRGGRDSPVLSTDANALDYLLFNKVGSVWHWLGIIPHA